MIEGLSLKNAGLKGLAGANLVGLQHADQAQPMKALSEEEVSNSRAARAPRCRAPAAERPARRPLARSRGPAGAATARAAPAPRAAAHQKLQSGDALTFAGTDKAIELIRKNPGARGTVARASSGQKPCRQSWALAPSR